MKAFYACKNSLRQSRIFMQADKIKNPTREKLSGFNIFNLFLVG